MHKESRNNPRSDDTGLIGKILGHAERLTDIDKRMKVPTHPFYDSGNFPDEATYGQIVVDKDDPSSLWVYGKDDEWHKVGGNNIDMANGTTIGAWNVNPGFNPATFYTFDTTNPGVFSLSGDSTEILVHKKGIYFGGWNAQIFAFAGRPVGTRMGVGSGIPGGTNVSNFSFGNGVDIAIPGTTDTWAPYTVAFFKLATDDLAGLPVTLGVQNYDSVVAQVHAASVFLMRLTPEIMTLW